MSTQFPTWKTVTLGTHKNSDALTKAVEQGGAYIYSEARKIMSKPSFMVASEKSTVDLVLVSVRELGFFECEASYAKIVERVQELGLKLCEAEVGPQLCLQSPDPSIDQIKVHCLVRSSGQQYSFTVEHGDGKWWLDAHHDHGGTYRADDQLVLCK